jgi:RNA polymerase sigma-70 factor, ECF subfamily
MNFKSVRFFNLVEFPWENVKGEKGMLVKVEEENKNSDTPEEELVTQAQQGDAGAFEQLYRRYSKRVYYLCLRMVKNEAEAEDLTQEAFLRVFRKIHTFQGKSAFSTWLHRVSVNTVLMSLRKKRLVEIPLDHDGHIEEEPGVRRQIPCRPDLSLIGLFDRENLRRVFRTMPDGYKRMLVLHDVLGYEHNEIALLAKCSVGNSKSQLHKARVRMRALL